MFNVFQLVHLGEPGLFLTEVVDQK